MSLARALARRCVLEAPPLTWTRPEPVPEGLTCLDANENEWAPWGPELARYPDVHHTRLRSAWARSAGVTPEQILATNGADEAGDLLIRAFCEPGEDSVAIFQPGYPMHARYAHVAGVAVRPVSLGLWEDGDALAQARDLGDAKLIFLCRPNNPTGQSLPLEAVRALLRCAPGLLVVDEAYTEFSDEPRGLVDWLEQEPRLVLMRTLSKAHGLAGLRVGAVLASPEIIEVLNLARLPFNLGAPAAEKAIEALEHPERALAAIEELRRERRRLTEGLQRLPGLEVLPSQANFVFARVPNAARISRALRGRGILIRDRSSIPGAGESLRITVGLPEANTRLLAELEQILKEISA